MARRALLLDDEAAARQIVRSGTAKGYGAARIRQMLYAKHIPRELWDEALAELPEQDDAIDAFLQKRFRGRQPDRTEIRRAADALPRRGHAWGDIRPRSNVTTRIFRRNKERGTTPMGKRVGMISLGCAKNQVNAEQMLYRLQQAGYTLQEDVDGADP